MKVTPRHFGNVNHHKPLGSMMLPGAAILDQFYCCSECIPSGTGPNVAFCAL